MGKFFASEKPATKKFGIHKSGVSKRSYSNGNIRGFQKKTKYSLTEDNDLSIPDWNTMVLKPFKKDFYVPHENIINRYIFYTYKNFTIHDFLFCSL